MLIIISIILLIFIYSVIPTVLIRIFSIQIIKKGHIRQALTFDDGPNPVYTPALLDLLKRHHIKATFFVVGSKATKYPDIIKRMHEEGHEIGIHHYEHRSSWILLPHLLKQEIRKTDEAIQRIIGVKPKYYRPPWGHFNLFTLVLKGDYKVIMWSAIFGDWKVRVGKEELVRRLRKGWHPGAIILLHDCGETKGADQKAPKIMLQALETFLMKRNDRHQMDTISSLLKEKSQDNI